jgi:hypothetical protein
MPASYFLGNRLLGTSPKQAMWDDTTPLAGNEAMFCPTCGEVWGRVLIWERSPWHTTTRNCAKHPTCLDSPGSFIASWRTTFEELPPEVLAYELQLRLNREKETQS